MTFTKTHCEEMIRHYREQSINWTKPQQWRDLALTSLAGWENRLATLGSKFWDDELPEIATTRFLRKAA
jgi:hypothetical protein